MAVISGIKYYKQKDPDYCAPTCASMLLSSSGIDLPQEEIAKKVMKIDSQNHRRTFTNDLCSYLSSLGQFPVVISGLPDNKAWSLLIEFLESNTPVMVSQRYGLELPAGHFRIVIGHDVIGKNDTEIVIYHDPYSGSFQNMKKDVFQELWRPSGGAYSDIRVPNQIAVILKKKSELMKKSCMVCNNSNLVIQEINTQQTYPDFKFIYPEGQVPANGTRYACENCKVSISHFDN